MLIELKTAETDDDFTLLADLARDIWLVVNRNNVGTISAYEKMAFINKGELQTDIGNGYIMDDYQLVKVVSFTGLMNMTGA